MEGKKRKQNRVKKRVEKKWKGRPRRDILRQKTTKRGEGRESKSGK